MTSKTTLQQEVRRLAHENAELRKVLRDTENELGAALGTALTALEDPEMAMRQLATLVRLADTHAIGRPDRLAAPHWHTVSMVLNQKAAASRRKDETPEGGA